MSLETLLKASNTSNASQCGNFSKEITDTCELQSHQTSTLGARHIHTPLTCSSVSKRTLLMASSRDICETQPVLTSHETERQTAALELHSPYHVWSLWRRCRSDQTPIWGIKISRVHFSFCEFLRRSRGLLFTLFSSRLCLRETPEVNITSLTPISPKSIKSEWNLHGFIRPTHTGVKRDGVLHSFRFGWMNG